MSEERFYVLESSGRRGTSAGNTRSRGRMPTEVMILDRYYCHRVIWSRWSGGVPDGGQSVTLEDVRRVADRICSRLNEEERLEVAAA